MNKTTTTALEQAERLASTGQWRPALALLEAANTEAPRAELQQRLLELRIRAGRELIPGTVPAVAPMRSAMLAAPLALPEISAGEFCAQTLRTHVQGAGALIVRKLLDSATAERLRQLIDRVNAAREQPTLQPPVESQAAWYWRSPEVRGAPARFFASPGQKPAASSTLWVADSPRAACELIALYHRLGLPAILQQHFEEPALLSVKKWVLRRVAPGPDPSASAGWHQDGRFLGAGIRALNMWLPLSHCGGDRPAPGLDIVANGERRIYPTGSHGAVFDWTVGPALVAGLATDAMHHNPEFDPGDVLFFDHYNLHRTAFRPHQTQPRYAVESWFFARSSAPAKQQPLLL